MSNVHKMLNNLPASWSTADLGDLLERITNGMNANQSKVPVGIPISRIETISQGVVNFERVQYVTDVDEKKIEHFSLKKGDILFSHINSDLHLGKTAVFQSDKLLLHGINLLLLRTKSNLLDPKYLHYILNLYRASGLFMAIAQHAVNQSSLNQTKIKSLKIPLSPRIEDQQQIVAEIEKQFSRLDEAVAVLKRIQANLKRYKAAVLKVAVEGKLTEQWRKDHPDVEPADQLLKRILAERRAKWEAEELTKMKAKGLKPKDDSWKKKYKEPAGPDTANLPASPEGWVWATLEQLTTQVTDVDHRMPKAQEGGIPYISTKDFTGENEINFSCAKRISSTDYDLLCKKVHPVRNDILLSRYGTVGEVRVVKTDIPFQVSYSVAIIKPVIESKLTSFITISLKSDAVQSQIKRDVRATAQPDLGLAHIRKLIVPLPALMEQQQILAEVDRRFSVTEELETTIETNLKRAERLRQTILTSAFSGDLTK